MSSLVIASIAFVCAIAGTLRGFWLRAALPESHLSSESKEVVKLGIGMIATTTALILGLMTASAKSAFDKVDASNKRSATSALALHRVLAAYAPEAAPVRELLRTSLVYRLAVTWPEDGSRGVRDDTPGATEAVETMERMIVSLSPQDAAHTWYRSQALVLMSEILRTRWAILGTTQSSISPIFLEVEVFWLALIFGSFAPFAPRNATVMTVLTVCAFSVSASVFLILEMDEPFGGVMKISSAPLRYTIESLGQ